MSDWTTLTYAVVDVEGNGQQPPDLVELSIIPITGGIIGTPVTWLTKPEKPIRGFASRIHGLRDADVADAPPFAAIHADVTAALNASALVAHNAHVDVNVLRRKIDGWNPPEVFDTLKLARRLVPGLDSYRLGALVERFGLDTNLPPGLRPHRATYDTLVTARLFIHLATQTGTGALTLADLRGSSADGTTDSEPSLF